MKRIVALLLAAVLLAAVPAPARAAVRSTPSGVAYQNIGAEFDAYVEKYRSGLVSASVSVFDASGELLTKCYGYADIESAVPADEETVYEWASASKLLVWVCVMQLWERGQLDLDADIRSYLPDGFLTKLQYPEETISMRNLMSHNAGFQESMYENQMATEDELFANLEEAVRKCECYQAYHVGEHTAYSNWSTALAAYIVERVSGTDYVSYVHKNIFEPLGMEHTSIDMHSADNPWVRQKREQIKCYARYADAKYNEDYGVARSWVQLYPAGAAIGTIGDFARFAQGFVATDCPFFASDATREEMLTATSYYGESDIALNCHGLWTAQFAVQTLGHGGNSNMTSNLQFDPESGLGIVVLSNEPGETMFCTGFCTLLFGGIMDSELVKARPLADHPDASGVYCMARSIARGFGRASRFAGGLLIVKKTADPDVFDMPMTGGMQLRHIGDKLWLQCSPSGDSNFCYETRSANGRVSFSIMSTDLIQIGPWGSAAYFGFAFFGFGCLIALAIWAILALIRKARGQSTPLTAAEWQIRAEQALWGVSGVILFCLISSVGVKGYGFAVFSCLAAAILALSSAANGVLLAVRTAKEKSGAKAARQYLWAALCLCYTAVIVWFQLYDFVHI